VPKSFNSYFLHCVFATKGRARYLSPEIALRLYQYLCGISRAAGIEIYAIGGVEDHVHVLISPPPSMGPAKAMQLLKANSSSWIRETFPKLRGFAWQEGYGAFSVSASNVPNVIEYIKNQTEHHRRVDSREEFVLFLKRHGIELPSRVE
jgi:REP-associated tyrosine transposase